MFSLSSETDLAAILYGFDNFKAGDRRDTCRHLRPKAEGLRQALCRVCQACPFLQLASCILLKPEFGFPPGCRGESVSPSGTGTERPGSFFLVVVTLLTETY